MDYGLDPKQFRALVIRPVLTRLSMSSAALEVLLLGTALQESRLQYIHQLGSGPALGVFQMEPATHFDLWQNYLKYHADLKAATIKLASYYSGDLPDPGEMVGNMSYATAMASFSYLRHRQLTALPAATDAPVMAQLYKTYYNGPGAATVDQALQHFEFAVSTTT